MRRFLLLAAVAVAAAAPSACGDVAGPDERWADPERIAYAPQLGVDLTQMQLSPTGLYWQDVVVGTGAAAGVSDRVYVYYSGWLPDGTLFDSNVDDEPLVFRLAEGIVIRGWDEGIIGMQVGGKRRLVIPPHLAYGRRGNGPIPPLATLIFDVELVNVVK